MKGGVNEANDPRVRKGCFVGRVLRSPPANKGGVLNKMICPDCKSVDFTGGQDILVCDGCGREFDITPGKVEKTTEGTQFPKAKRLYANIALWGKIRKKPSH